MGKFSELLIKVRDLFGGTHKNHLRPDWDSYFLSIAAIASTRSHDAETQHGCVITEDNRIVGVGYNGFPRGLSPVLESILPNTRPKKYPFMLHSERNALANCVIRPTNGIAYGTGMPCNNCLMALWQSGVKEFVYNVDGYDANQKTECFNVDVEIRDILLSGTNMELRSARMESSLIMKLVDSLGVKK